MSCFWKNLRSTRTRVLLNLCVAIGMTDVLIVAMEIADVQNQVGYQAVVYTSSRLIDNLRYFSNSVIIHQVKTKKAQP